MIQERIIDFVCAAGLVKNRFVTITKSNKSVAYTAAGAKPDGITITDESNLQIGVQLLANLERTFFFDAAGVIAIGAEVEVGADGKGQTQTSGAIACYAMTAAVANSICTGYNITPQAMTPAGTPATGFTAVEGGFGAFHRTTLTINTTLGAIAGGAALALGKLAYTLPAGAKIVKSAYGSIILDELDGNITADTPDVGLGTTLASGANALLSTAGATTEDILTGQTAADCNGTATVKTVANQIKVIETGDAHTIYLNVADTWAAGGEAACPVTGTIVLEWYSVN